MRKDVRDAQILIAVSGNEDVSNLPIQIERDYLIREEMENLREQGFPVSEEYQVTEKSELERDIFRHQKMMEELEGIRVNRKMGPYPGWDEDDWVPEPKRVVKV